MKTITGESIIVVLGKMMDVRLINKTIYKELVLTYINNNSASVVCALHNAYGIIVKRELKGDVYWYSVEYDIDNSDDNLPSPPKPTSNSINSIW